MASGQAEMGDKCELPTKNGIRTIVVNRLPVRAPDGTVVGAISQSLFGDANELKQVAQRIVQLEKKVDLYSLKIGSALFAKYSLANIHGQSRGDGQRQGIGQTLRPERFAGPDRRSHRDRQGVVLPRFAPGKSTLLPSFCKHQLRRQFLRTWSNRSCSATRPAPLPGRGRRGKIGFIELADKGTLFLDEIGDMPLSAQAKVLRVLEDKLVYRVGGTKPHSVDFRLVVATNRELRDMFRSGTFREDLYYRFSAMTINVPSLCERIEDIPILIRHLLDRLGKSCYLFEKRDGRAAQL